MKIKIDYGRLQLRCTQTEREITESLPRGFTEIKGPINSAWFKDSGPESTILAVAHMDTVRKEKYFGFLKIPDDSIIYSPYLDDRVGVYTVLDMLPKLGIKCDVLLTTDEETCNTSAKLFTTKKQYNWIVEFDRKGDDVVTYGMASDEMLHALECAKFHLGWGTYSDIVSMTHLQTCAFNVGVGYQNCHSTDAHMSVRDYVKNMKKFVFFYHHNRDVRYPLAIKQHTSRGWDNWDDYDSTRYGGSAKATQLRDRVELNECTGREVHTDSQQCPDCGLELDYMGNGFYACWVCDKEFEYNYDDDTLENTASWKEDKPCQTGNQQQMTLNGLSEP